MEDRQVLASGAGRIEEKVAFIADEFRRGFQAVAQIGRPAMTVFGSARVREDDPVYEGARECGRLLAREGFAVITGGGPGVMEAANRGCQEEGGVSVGFNITLPHEQRANPYVDIGLEFKHFYARKVMMVKAAEGFVIYPGRVVRVAHAHPDRRGGALPGGAHGPGLLAAAGQFGHPGTRRTLRPQRGPRPADGCRHRDRRRPSGWRVLQA